MTSDKNFKRLVRERMTSTGERYTAAHAAIVEQTPQRVSELLTEFERAGTWRPDRKNNEHLLSEALRLIESAGQDLSSDLVHLFARLLDHQWDVPARVELLAKYLEQELPVEEEAWARWERADSMAVLGATAGPDEWSARAVEAQRELAEFVTREMSAAELPWVWHDSTMAGAWTRIGLRDEWLTLVEPVIENAVTVPENRSDRFELLFTAASIYDIVGKSERVDEMVAAMREVLVEDPAWHERQWAEDRLHKQAVMRCLHRDDHEGMRAAAQNYRRWVDSQSPPVMPSPLGDIGFLFLLAEDYETAIHYCQAGIESGDPFGYTFVWYAASVMGKSGDVELAGELLGEARSRMAPEEVLAAFRQRPEFAAHLDDPRLREAIKA